MNAAANDTATEKIQITLYRLDPESTVVYALISAAKNGKNVTTVI